MDVLGWIVLAAAFVAFLATGIFYKRYRQTEAERSRLATNYDILEQAFRQDTAELAAARQKITDLKERMQEWEAQKSQIIDAVQAAALKSSRELSGKLLDDHKREKEEAEKQSAERTKKITEPLMEQYKIITDKLATVRNDRDTDAKQLATVMRALSSPAGAGEMTEINLENTLKNLRLESPTDFMMQYHLPTQDGKRLRPDCVIFLPQNRVMVIDCKASKFVLEVAAAATEEEKASALKQLAQTMQDHLKALVSKDYRGVIEEYYRASGRSDHISHVFSVMYLPTEEAVATVKRADPSFQRKTEEAQIILAAHASLHGLLMMSQMQIGQAKRAENQEHLVQAAENLLDALHVALGYVDKVGKSIKSAAEHFDDFAKSANSRLLRRVDAMLQLGAKPKKQHFPKRIAEYNVHVIEGIHTVETTDDPSTPMLAHREEETV